MENAGPEQPDKYSETLNPHDLETQERNIDPLPKQRSIQIPSGPEYDDEGELPRQSRPTRGEDGRLQFEGRWNGVFTPNVTPEEMFAKGAFAGAFFA